MMKLIGIKTLSKIFLISISTVIYNLENSVEETRENLFVQYHY